jgi:hypothetical protein
LITILDTIPFDINLPHLFKQLRVREASRHEQQLRQLVAEAQALARPKAIYALRFVEARGDEWVKIDKTTFESRILCVNLLDSHRVFPYVATCGIELETWSSTLDDFLLAFWADTIKEMALRKAVQALQQAIDSRYNPGPLSSMNPGSLGDWPLTAQPSLFSLLGDVGGSIGVQLTASYLMLPTKSVSGIYFPTDRQFVSCQLCPRQNCQGRRSPYEPGLYETRYAVKAGQQPF